jgi:SAM-dependent methyltransferase
MARKGSSTPKATPKATTKGSPKRSPSPSARGAGAVKRFKTALVALPFSDYHPSATIFDDAKTISSMWFGSIDGETHQDRLESFYKNQAELYDGYRARMLHARKPMMTRLMVERERKGEVLWVDLGGGTGANVEFMSSAIREGWFKEVVVLDLAPSLCQVAQRRAQDKWPGVVRVVCGDACNTKEKGLPAAGTCDIVTISYALVMIPDWKAAVSLSPCPPHLTPKSRKSLALICAASALNARCSRCKVR